MYIQVLFFVSFLSLSVLFDYLDFSLFLFFFKREHETNKNAQLTKKHRNSANSTGRFLRDIVHFSRFSFVFLEALIVSSQDKEKSILKIRLISLTFEDVPEKVSD